MDKPSADGAWMALRACCTGAEDDPSVLLGWAVYGVGARSVGAVVFTIAPLLLTSAARLQDSDGMAPLQEMWSAGNTTVEGGLIHAIHHHASASIRHLRPSSVPTFTISAGLFLQCITAPLIATIADRLGLRRTLMAAHVALGISCAVSIGLLPPDAPLGLQATLVALVYYCTSLAWMLQNSLLPSVASLGTRTPLSLFSSALASLGGAAFLLWQYSVLTADTSGDPDTLYRVFLMAAACWAASASLSLLLLSTLRTTPPLADPAACTAANTASGPPEVSALADALHGLSRVLRHRHAARFIAAQTLYIAAATADAANATVFAREVVGLSVARITLLTVYAALSGAAGAMGTLAASKLMDERSLLLCLMCIPPPLLLYTSFILSSEREFFAVGIARAFVAGGVGSQGLNRGVFSQMVPRGHEAEFFGAYFVAVKLTSWIGPMLCTVVNEATQSLRTAVLTSLVFYVPALLVMTTTDFAKARCDARSSGGGEGQLGEGQAASLRATGRGKVLRPQARTEGAPLLAGLRPRVDLET